MSQLEGNDPVKEIEGEITTEKIKPNLADIDSAVEGEKLSLHIGEIPAEEGAPLEGEEVKLGIDDDIERESANADVQTVLVPENDNGGKVSETEPISLGAVEIAEAKEMDDQASGNAVDLKPVEEFSEELSKEGSKEGSKEAVEETVNSVVSGDQVEEIEDVGQPDITSSLSDPSNQEASGDIRLSMEPTGNSGEHIRLENDEGTNFEQPVMEKEEVTIQLSSNPEVSLDYQENAQNDDTSESQVEKEKHEQLKDETESDEHTENNGAESETLIKPEEPEQIGSAAAEERAQNISANAEESTQDVSLAEEVVKTDQEQHVLPSTENRNNNEHDESLIIPQSHEIVIPSYSRWFNLTKIHEIEMKSLPEFFTNRIPSKTPQVYVKYRNFMVNSYRINPNEYFTVIAARRNLCGDAGALFRIHKFLTKWGLINYQVNPIKKPRMIEPPFTGDYETSHDAPRGLFPFQSYKPPMQASDVSKLKNLMSGVHIPKRQLEESQSSAASNTIRNDLAEKKVEGNTSENTPGSPSNKDSINENTDGGHISKKPRIAEWVDKDWTKEELVKLIDAIKQHGTDWVKIAESVSSKTPEQCILRFLQLPIEDAFLRDEKEMGVLKFGSYLPFNKSDNPVMSTIAFLVGLVDPEIVQELTKRAISLHDSKSEIPDMDVKTTVKDGTEISLASMGLRSHVFATNQERLMNKITNELINAQLNKIDLKLKTLETMEKSLELERKGIQKKQEDVFVQRLSLAKYSTTLMNKLESLVTQFPENSAIQNSLEEIKQIIEDPPKASFTTQTTKSDSKDPDNALNPISIEAPQLYRYWSG